MACFHPITGYRVPGGQVKFTGSGPWTQRVTVPCGSCVGCGAERQRQWGVRGMHELQMSEDPVSRIPTASFLTLTYATEHLPENGNLDVKHWQDFAKRARAKIGKFKFLMCGEYGDEDNTERCHLHAILFGQDFSWDRTQSHKTPAGNQLFISPTLDKLWGKGLHTIGSVSFDSVAYVASYINKKVRGDEAKEYYRRTNLDTGEVYDQVPEFGLMSRGGRTGHGLGYSWIEKYHSEVYPSDEVIVNGTPGQPPDYYDRWYKKKYPDKWPEIEEKRKLKQEKYAADNTPERLAVKEAVFKARFRQYKERKRNKNKWSI